MPIQQKTKRLTKDDYKKIIPRDCEQVKVHTTYAISYEYWLWCPSDSSATVVVPPRRCQLLRPIFDISRERKAYEIRTYMTQIAKISAAQAREHLYKQELMKVHNGYLPEEIVEYIARYTWDIHLLL